MALKLTGFKGLIGKELIPNRRLGKEFSEYARLAAGVGGAVHTDELPAYGITAADVAAIEKKLGCKKNDAFIFVADTTEKAQLAMQSIAARASFHGIPSEVRKANPDGTTSFLRPMPGAARMYPETDTVSVKPNLAAVKLPELGTNKIDRYKKMGLGHDLATALVKTEKATLFEQVIAENKQLKAPFVAETLISYTKELFRLKLDPLIVKEQHLVEIFQALAKGKIAKQSVLEALADIAKTGKLQLEKYALLTQKEIEKELKSIVEKNKNLPFNALIGKAMAAFKGKADGKIVVELLKKHVKTK